MQPQRPQTAATKPSGLNRPTTAATEPTPRNYDASTNNRTDPSQQRNMRRVQLQPDPFFTASIGRAVQQRRPISSHQRPGSAKTQDVKVTGDSFPLYQYSQEDTFMHDVARMRPPSAKTAVHIAVGSPRPRVVIPLRQANAKAQKLPEKDAPELSVEEEVENERPSTVPPKSRDEKLFDTVKMASQHPPLHDVNAPPVAPNDEEDIQHMNNIEDVVSFFSCHAREYTPVKFVYMELLTQIPGQVYRPYDLVVAQNGRYNPADYYIVSSSGVIHVANNQPSEVTALSLFVREAALFNILSKIPFFRRYLVYKAFLQWRRNIRFKLFYQIRKKMARGFFFAKGTFATPLLELKRQSFELSLQPLVKYPAVREPISKEKFISMTNEQKMITTDNFRQIVQTIEDQLKIVCDQVTRTADIPDLATPEALEQYLIASEEEAAKQAGRRINVKAMSMTKMKENTTRRMQHLKRAMDDFTLLPQFIRLVDYFCAEALFSNAMLTMQRLQRELLRREEEKILFFTIAVTFQGKEGISFHPDEDEIQKMFEEVQSEVIGTVVSVARILGSRMFHVHFDTSPKFFSLSNNLKEDARIIHISASNHALVENDFADSRRATKDFGKNRRWFDYVNKDWPSLRQMWDDNIAKEQAEKDILALPQNETLSAQNFREVLKLVDEAVSQIREMIQMRRGCLVITPAAASEFLTTKLREIQTEAGERLMVLFKLRLDRVTQALNTRIRDLKDRPTGLQKFAAFVETLNGIVSTTNEMMNFADGTTDLFEVAEYSGCEVQQDVARLEKVLGGPHYQSTGDTKRDLYEREVGEAKEHVGNSMKDISNKLNNEIEKEIDKIDSTLSAVESPRLAQMTSDVEDVIKHLKDIEEAIAESEAQVKKFIEWQKLFGLEVMDSGPLFQLKQTFKEKLDLWNTIDRWQKVHSEYYQTPLNEIEIALYQKDVDELYAKTYSKLNPKHRNDASEKLLEQLREEKQIMPTLLNFGNKNLKKEHWMRILINQQRVYDPTITLNLLRQLKLFDPQYREVIAEQSALASGEAHLLQSVEDIREAWEQTVFQTKGLRDYKDQFILDDVADIVQQVEEHQLIIQGCLASRYVGGIRGRVEEWERKLTLLSQVIDEWIYVQGAWMYLEFIFSSEDIKKQLPTETQLFKNTDTDFRLLIKKAQTIKNCIDVATEGNVLETLEENHRALDEIQKKLEDYLETKRAAFPRFYFLSNDELLSILSDVRNPRAVRPHLRKCFDSIKDLVFQNESGTEIGGMISAEGEVVPYSTCVIARGNIETWLKSLEQAMISNLQEHTQLTLAAFHEMNRTNWILRVLQSDPHGTGFPAQCIQAIDMVQWTYETEVAILRVAGGENPNAVAEYFSTYCHQILDTVKVVRMDLTALQRNLVGTLLVIDVHNRDTIEQLVQHNVSSLKDFAWSMQLRYYTDSKAILSVQHVNASFEYAYEYLGSAKRLVITPLTDRAFLTCTGALHLHLGGAPQGPAGTGKTESVKDLGKALARQVVVFNCSDGINYAMMSQMFAGLAQAGAWACFDEFNRIELEVLSVIAQQMLEITTAITEQLPRMSFDGHDIALHPNFGVFITMNPGYAGRTELPDNLKALFRPVCMMIPDYRLIAEIMFFSEGFNNAKSLSVKMVQLYKLSSEQLSKQDHYDFGMRAVKSILVMAGSLKRAEPNEDEDMLLIRAMRDSNLPKFLRDDVKLFNSLIQDLYPNVKINEKQNPLLEQTVADELKVNKLVPIPLFITKILQLHETTIVRHGVMMVGQTLTGKTTCLTTLQNALTTLSAVDQHKEHAYYKPVHIHTVNPKSVTRDELYGAVNATTREWTDGILSNIVRKVVDGANYNADRHWVTFDGPVDAVWIENMNTVLDDNKMLCLVNGERLKIPDTVTFCFEVQDLKVASPATVSRCGMVYIEPYYIDGGWRPQFSYLNESLGEKYPNTWQKERLCELVEAVVSPALEFIGKEGKEWIPAVACQRVISMLRLLEALLVKNDVDDDEPITVELPKPEVNEDGREVPFDGVLLEVEEGVERALTAVAPNPNKLFDMYVAFAIIWGIGGNLCEKNAARDHFSEFVQPLLTKIIPNFPTEDSVFDISIHKKSISWQPWSYKVPNFLYRRNAAFFEHLVPVAESVATSYIVASMLEGKHHVLLNGSTGTGKSVGVQSVLYEQLKTEDISSVWQSFSMLLSAQTSSRNVQEKIESKLRKHPARTKGTLCMGPATGKTMILFVDDINMPQIEEYGASPPVELLRQLFVQGGFYDPKKLVFKEMIDMACMACCGPPGGGRNEMTQRFTSRFFMLCQPVISQQSILKIFSTILRGFFGVFSADVQLQTMNVALATVDAYQRISSEQLPTPEKSHYLFNLRDVAKVCQGILQITPAYCQTKDELAALWIHEASRTFHDRLISDTDREWWHRTASNIAQARFGVEATPRWSNLIFGDFAAREQLEYQPIMIDESLQEVLVEKMLDFGVQFSTDLDLVMFDYAIHHLCRIARILRQPRGNALLVGVGGSGRRSLAQLAAFIQDVKHFQITVHRGYGVNEFRDDLRTLLLETGCEEKLTAFILSDTQIVKEQFLEDVNNVINTGEVANLWQPEDFDRIMNSVRESVAEAGKPETPNVMMAHFVNLCRDNLHVVLCMSPVGVQFRNRLRMFPSFVNCMTIDWFSKWPNDALYTVATRSLQLMQLDSEELRTAIAKLAVHMHHTMGLYSEQFYNELRRQAYTTPTSYLSLLSLFHNMYNEQLDIVDGNILRFRAGVEKLADTRTQVDEMKESLEKMQPLLEKQTLETAKFAEQVEVEQKAASEVAIVVAQEEKECGAIMAEAKSIKDECQVELDKAMPAYYQAVEALNALNPRDINEAKAYASPPKKVEMVLDAVLTLLDEDKGWDNARKLMTKPDFIQNLRNFDKDHVPPRVLRALKKYTEMEDFKPEAVQNVSKACVSLCLWCRAIENYCEILKVVQPKREKLAVAEDKLAKANAALEVKQAELRKVQEKISNLKAQYQNSMEKKKSLEEEKLKTELYLSRAEKLLSGLQDEKVRWAESIEKYSDKKRFVAGYSIIASGLIAYSGPFSATYRNWLLADWTKKCEELGILTQPNFSLQDVVDPVMVRNWRKRGLPADDFSVQNGTIVAKSPTTRWCLCIDPQGQANSWIKSQYRDQGLKVLKMNEPTLIRSLENAIRVGAPVLLENVPEELDASLTPLLQKAIFKQAGRPVIRLRENAVDYDPKFFFIMTTRIPNPHYLPETQIKVTLLNFTVTTKGLEEQLLADVVLSERKELEERANNLVIQVSDAKSQLSEIEDKILDLMSSSSGDFLESDNFINTLANSKATSLDIAESLQIAETTSVEINTAREVYRCIATRGSLCYAVLSDVSNLEHMYQNSLAFFNKLFLQTLSRSRQSDDVTERCQILVESLTINAFTNGCRAMFEKHKPTFAFLLASTIARHTEDILEPQWNYFLRGAAGALVDVPKTGPGDWMSENMWEEFQFLASIPGFEGLDDNIVDKEDVWKQYYDDGDSPKPFFFANLSLWKQIVILRTFREERLGSFARQFVSDTLGKEFEESPTFDLNASYADSSNVTPIILVLSAGTDPTVLFNQFADIKGFANKKHTRSLGQGQGEQAEKMIATAKVQGEWVYLQNCHVYTSWMPRLEMIVEETFLGDPHPDYRLWLTTMPSPDFPVPVLQSSVKVTREPPTGLKANLRDTFGSSIDSTVWDWTEKNTSTWHRLVFCLALFHGVIQERRRFGALGWNVPYEWNAGDLDASLKALRGYVEEFDTVPWDAVHYILGTINYGGRVTDNWDLKCLDVTMSRFVGAHCLDADISFTSDNVYRIPSTIDNFGQLMEYIQDLPINENPEIFGLNLNANLTLQGKVSRAFMRSVVEVQPKVTAAGAGHGDVVLQAVEEYIQRLPDEIDRSHSHQETYRITEQGAMISLGTVCLQEIDRYNTLLRKLSNTLHKLRGAIRGEVVMDRELEEMHGSISFFLVPKIWEKAAYPSLKPLSSWFADLITRIDFFRDWNDSGMPQSYWLGGFFFPQGFLTGVLQTHSRQFKLPIDQLRFIPHPTTDTDPDEAHLDIINTGVYVHGLYMEGGRWDVEKKCITESLPRQLFARIPIIRLEPVDTPDTDKTSYECPVYKISSRAGVLSTTGISTNFILPLKLNPGSEDAGHWTGRGTACLTTLDD